MIRAVILNHFAEVDPIIHTVLIERQAQIPAVKAITDPEHYFARLVEDIISQQLAGKAVEAITNRFLNLFPDRVVTPDQLLKCSEPELRVVGLSGAKARYIRDLAEHTQQGKIQYAEFKTMSNKEIIFELTQVKGIGQWTAEMFLLFTLGKEDIFSFGDLGLKNAFQRLYKVPESSNLKTEMERVAASWTPYRSYGSLGLWRFLDNREV